MEMEMEFINKEDTLVPIGYKICEVMPLSDYLISKSTVLYKTDEITIRQLVDQYEKNERLTEKLKNKKEKVCFLVGKSKLSVEEDDTLKKLKHKLHNYKITTFVFYPYIQKYGAMVLQCAPSFADHEDYCDQQNANNTVNACLYFPQIHPEKKYCSLLCSKTVLSEITTFLKKSSFAQNAKLWQYKMEIECLICTLDNKIDPNQLVSDTISDGHIVQVTFPNIKASKSKDQRSKVIIRIYKNKDNLMKQFTYAEIGDLSVQSIKNVCLKQQLNKQQLNWNALRILNKILKSFELLSTLHSKIMDIGGIIDAYIVYEAQLFYRTLSQLKQLNDKQIDMESNETKDKIEDEIQKKKEQRQIVQQIKYSLVKKLRDDRMRQLNQNVNKQFKKIEFFDPIWCYTSSYIYENLNKFLNSQIFIKHINKDISSSWYMQFTFCLINSLLKLPNYQGTVYRGQKISYDFKVGNIVSFKSFISTSRSKKIANGFGRQTLFIINCLSGKNVERFSYYPKEEEVLMLPYSYFKVLSIEQINSENNITLLELPAPKRLNQNLIVWVDDKPQDNIDLFNQFKKEKPQIKSELIQLISNDHLKLWLEYYGHHLLNPNIKVMAITNMRRREDTEAGIETIKQFRKLDPNIEINIFVVNSLKTLQILSKNKMALSEKLILENRGIEHIESIKKKIIDTEQVEKESGCLVM